VAANVRAHIRALALLGELLGLARMAPERAPWPATHSSMKRCSSLPARDERHARSPGTFRRARQTPDDEEQW